MIDSSVLSVSVCLSQVKVQVCGLKLVLIDPTLGLHLPLLKLVVANLATMLCYMPDTEVTR